MEESRWYNSAEEIRAVEGLVREGRHHEAIERARHTLLSGQVGRKSAARLHSLICRVYAEELQEPCASAILHAEEAVRLAQAVRDPWIKSEALSHLVHACCQVGDLARASSACDALAAEVEQNAAVVPGGQAALLLLRATVRIAGQDWTNAADLLAQAEAAAVGEDPAVAARIYASKLSVLLERGAYGEARAMLEQPLTDAEGESAVVLARGLGRAWLALAESDMARGAGLVAELAELARASRNTAAWVQALALQVSLAEGQDAAGAARLARLTHERSVCLGRVDLARWLATRLRHLL